ncbi:hypothetical protein [Sporosarcina saromensis]|uniref:Uncharacterized protein n=1 Tax=Sporosarcina saromensis TaxID=359365 RepID=A0ABU4G8E0_9BACL|nr:hypothetical protein [Sporosarcina saromensis]MDW0113248.1 hypothetical protein [Sporosarcina saromensis]
MYNEMYSSFGSAIISLFIWWGLLLVFQRIIYRDPQRNSWKKDLLLTFIQSVVVLLSLPLLASFLGK